MNIEPSLLRSSRVWMAPVPGGELLPRGMSEWVYKHQVISKTSVSHLEPAYTGDTGSVQEQDIRAYTMGKALGGVAPAKATARGIHSRLQGCVDRRCSWESQLTQLIVPADTRDPSSLGTGNGSPVSMDSSTALLPPTTLPCKQRQAMSSNSPRSVSSNRVLPGHQFYAQASSMLSSGKRLT